MKNIFLLGFVLLFLSNCASRSSSADENFKSESTLIASENRNSKPDENDKRENSVPNNSEIRRVDFKNFVYPDGITIENGVFDASEKSGSKTNSRLEYAVEDVRYADFTNDAREDALVDLTTFMGGGSSIYKHGFHLYTLEKGKARLQWRLTTGSEADCGLKEIRIENKKLFLEAFGKCYIEEDSLRGLDYDTDVNTSSFTRFTFGWNNRKFVRENLEILPFPENNIHDYERRMKKNRLNEQ